MPSAGAAMAQAPDVHVPLLQVRNLSVQYGGVLALEPVSFDVGAHTLTVVLGPNGAGKSSLLRALAGAVPPRSGSVVIVCRRRVPRAAARRQRRKRVKRTRPALTECLSPRFLGWLNHREASRLLGCSGWLQI
jgi:ABC-type molybdenum transport system ATPase subunit/photorepair protein PhrA